MIDESRSAAERAHWEHVWATKHADEVSWFQNVPQP
jgi:hypothetical protein